MSRNKFAVARRSIWYMLKLLLITALVFTLALSVFVTAMYVSNIYIILTEGMELRTKSILQNTSVLELTEYFTEEFIANDSALHDGKYDGYTVSNYEYRIKIKKLPVYPWSNKVSVQIMDKVVSLAGTANNAAEGADAAELPAWTPTSAQVTLVKRGTRWYIDEIKVLALNPPEEALPTPDMRLLEAQP